MRSIPVGAGLPSPPTLLFYRPSKTLLLQGIRADQFIADCKHFEALKAYQNKCIYGNATYKNSFSFHIGSAVAVQHEDGGPWTQGVVEEMNGNDHHRQSYSIRVTKTGGLIMHSMRHIHSTLITTRQYL